MQFVDNAKDRVAADFDALNGHIRSLQRERRLLAMRVKRLQAENAFLRTALRTAGLSNSARRRIREQLQGENS